MTKVNLLFLLFLFVKVNTVNCQFPGEVWDVKNAISDSISGFSGLVYEVEYKFIKNRFILPDTLQKKEYKNGKLVSRWEKSFLSSFPEITWDFKYDDSNQLHEIWRSMGYGSELTYEVSVSNQLDSIYLVKDDIKYVFLYDSLERMTRFLKDEQGSLKAMKSFEYRDNLKLSYNGLKSARSLSSKDELDTLTSTYELIYYDDPDHGHDWYTWPESNIPDSMIYKMTELSDTAFGIIKGKKIIYEIIEKSDEKITRILFKKGKQKFRIVKLYKNNFQISSTFYRKKKKKPSFTTKWIREEI